MSFSVTKRFTAACMILIVLAIIFLASAVEFAEGHPIVCTGNDCFICLVANTLNGIRSLISVCVVTSVAFIVLQFVCEAVRGETVFNTYLSPIVLKTKILS